MMWNDFDRPVLVLAPMDDVTDTVFRQIVAKCAPPDIFFTEFVSVDGLMSRGREHVQRKLQFTEVETPLVAQVWGLKPDNYESMGDELATAGYAGIDINMGCPSPVVIKNGACSALAKEPARAKELIEALKAGVNGRLPVSVKCRIGFDHIDLGWLRFLLEQDLDVLTIHGRTTKELSKVPVHWEVIESVVKMRDEMGIETKIIANGDILTRQEAEQKIDHYKLDGAMLGRAIFQDPFVFHENSPWKHMTPKDKLELYAEHIALFLQTWGNQKNPASLKKFAKVYVNGFDGASNMRDQLMKTSDARELLDVIEKHKNL